MRKILITTFCTCLVVLTSAHAEEKALTADEARALFSGKTFDGYNENKGKSYKVYSSPDGTMLHRNSKRTKEVTWEIDSKGRHCAQFNINKRKCGNIVPMGNGVYHKVKNGEHTHTLKNFVEGNQL